MTTDGSETTTSGFQLEDGLEILERRKWWLAIAAVAGALLGLGLCYAIPPRYQSSTTILVEPQGVPEDYIKSTITLTIEERLDTLRERVTSFSNLSALIDRLGAERLDPSGEMTREQLIGYIGGNLSVEIGSQKSKRAAVFEMIYFANDPQVAADVAREIANLFISENLKDRAQQATATSEFLDRELDRLRADVSVQEEKLRKFKEERMGSLPGELETNLRALDRMNNELAANLQAQESIAQRTALLSRQLSGSVTTAAGAVTSVGPAPGSSGAALLNARTALNDALRTYTDEHPNVRRLRGEVQRLEQEVKAGGSSRGASLDPTVMAVQGEIAAAQLEGGSRKREEARLRQQLAELQVRVAKTPQMEQELVTLTRDYENLTTTYQHLLAKKYEAALAKNLEAAQKGERFKVLRPAYVPSSPSFPTLLMFLPGGLGLGLAICGVAILVSEIRNPAFRSVSRLTRQLGLPVFASIPRIDNDQIFATPPTENVDPRLVVYTAPQSAPAEQYRSFIPTLLEDTERRVVLVTSAARGDGKSLSCMNLALTVACDLNRRVLVIDGDLRRPTAHRLLRIRPKLGLVDVLKGEAGLADAALNTRIPNLTLLPAGRPVSNPLALLTNPAFLALLEEARKHYDAVFIDSPPLMPVVDTRFLKKMADLVIFVVRADSTPRAAVARSLHELRDCAGLVFNQVSPGSFRRYYYYDAYARYAYGEPNEEPEVGDDA
jgi:polysaccharide chain length determinant protein (PEP-CTERM system associated)